MSRLWTQDSVLQAYDDAVVNWLSNFWYPVMESYVPSIGTSKSLASYSFDGSAVGARRWSKIDFDFKEYFVGTITRGHISNPIWLGFPEAPFTLRGPYYQHLRVVFAKMLARYPLPQNSRRVYQRKSGQFRVQG